MSVIPKANMNKLIEECAGFWLKVMENPYPTKVEVNDLIKKLKEIYKMKNDFSESDIKALYIKFKRIKNPDVAIHDETEPSEKQLKVEYLLTTDIEKFAQSIIHKIFSLAIKGRPFGDDYLRASDKKDEDWFRMADSLDMLQSQEALRETFDRKIQKKPQQVTLLKVDIDNAINSIANACKELKAIEHFNKTPSAGIRQTSLDSPSYLLLSAMQSLKAIYERSDNDMKKFLIQKYKGKFARVPELLQVLTQIMSVPCPLKIKPVYLNALRAEIEFLKKDELKIISDAQLGQKDSSQQTHDVTQKSERSEIGAYLSAYIKDMNETDLMYLANGDSLILELSEDVKPKKLPDSVLQAFVSKLGKYGINVEYDSDRSSFEIKKISGAATITKGQIERLVSELEKMEFPTSSVTKHIPH